MRTIKYDDHDGWCSDLGAVEMLTATTVKEINAKLRHDPDQTVDIGFPVTKAMMAEELQAAVDAINKMIKGTKYEASRAYTLTARLNRLGEYWVMTSVFKSARKRG